MKKIQFQIHLYYCGHVLSQTLTHTHTSALTLMPQWESEPLQTPDLTDSITNICHMSTVCVRVCTHTLTCLTASFSVWVTVWPTVFAYLVAWQHLRMWVVHMTDEDWRRCPLVREKEVCSSGHVVFSADKTLIRALVNMLQLQWREVVDAQYVFMLSTGYILLFMTTEV